FSNLAALTVRVLINDANLRIFRERCLTLTATTTTSLARLRRLCGFLSSLGCFTLDLTLTLYSLYRLRGLGNLRRLFSLCSFTLATSALCHFFLALGSLCFTASGLGFNLHSMLSILTIFHCFTRRWSLILFFIFLFVSILFLVALIFIFINVVIIVLVSGV